MSDLSDLHGIFPTSVRWNAEQGFLSAAIYDPTTGGRELQPFEFGQESTFAMDLATRMRGYGMIRVGVYDMRLTPVSKPPPPWGNDLAEFKAALGCWLWHPAYGELRLETCATTFRDAMAAAWQKALGAPEAVEGQQPVIRFVDKVAIRRETLKKVHYGPIIHIVGWEKRNDIPGWRHRAPTVAPPAAPVVLAPPTPPAAKIAAPKSKKGPAKPADPDDDLPPSKR